MVLQHRVRVDPWPLSPWPSVYEMYSIALMHLVERASHSDLKNQDLERGVTVQQGPCYTMHKVLRTLAGRLCTELGDL